jgi:hypothetical protein
MTLRLNGSTSGYTEIDAPAVAGNNNLKLPTGNGSDGNILGTDGAGNLSWVNGRMVLATAQNSTSGTFVDFTGIPSWVKKITVMFNGVSTNGTSPLIIQLGTGPSTFITSGYTGAVSTSVSTTFSSTGFSLTIAAVAAGLYSGQAIISSMSGNNWVSTSIMAQASVNGTQYGATSVAAGAVIDRIRITTVNGTDTFDAGSINILYEG